MYCTKCGKKLPENASFCPYCRNPVTGGGRRSVGIRKELRSSGMDRSVIFPADLKILYQTKDREYGMIS